MSDSKEKLTKHISGKTLLTEDFANSFYGGLYGSEEASLLESDDPKVVGHVHDGKHADGHSQKVNLVSHVTGKLESTNLAAGSVSKTNIYKSLNQSEGIPFYETSGGQNFYYLDLSLVNVDVITSNGASTVNSVTFGSTESPVGKIDVHHTGEAIDNSDMNQFAVNVVNGREKLSFSGILSYSDGGGGTTTITTNANHGLVTNDGVVISGTTNYNGIFNVTKIGDRSFKITRSYAVETPSGNEEIRKLSSEVGLGFRVSSDVSAVSPGAAITHKRYVNASTHTDDSVGSLNFKTKSSSSAKDLDTRMTIDKDGNVGIGTLTPDEILHVHNSGSVSIAKIGDLGTFTPAAGSATTSTNGYARLGMVANNNSNNVKMLVGARDSHSDGSQSYGQLGTISSHDVRLYTNNDTKAVIKNSGKFGIGTSAPDKQLEINSSDGNNLRLTYNDSDGSASNYTDFTLSSGGDLTINPSGGDTTLSSNLSLSGHMTSNLDLNGAELILDADADTSITADTDDQIDFKVGGSDRFSITASKVDLGSFEIEGSNFDINGGTISSVSGSFTTLSCSGHTTLGDASADTVTFNAGSLSFASPTTVDLANSQVSALNIESGLFNIDTLNSRVGIGTTNPQVELHVNSTGDADILLSRQDTYLEHGEVLGSIYFGATNDGSNFTYGASIEATISGDMNSGQLSSNDFPTSLRFYTTPDGSSSRLERLTIAEDGRLGVGVSDPSSMLDIAAQIPNVAIASYNAGSSGPSLDFSHSRNSTKGNYTVLSPDDFLGKIDFNGATNSGFVRSASIISKAQTSGSGYTGAGSFFFRVKDTSLNETEVVSIAPSGAVHIRTDGTDAAVRIPMVSSLEVNQNSSNPVAHFVNDGNNQNREGVKITCGVDTPNDASKCIFLRFADGDGGDMGGVSTGGATAQNPAFFNGSDVRIKRDVAPTSINGLNILNSLDMVQYRWEDGWAKDDSLKEIGFTAQSCEKVFPQMVFELDHENFDFPVKNIMQAELIPVLVKAVQELSEKVKYLEGQLSNKRDNE